MDPVPWLASAPSDSVPVDGVSGPADEVRATPVMSFSVAAETWVGVDDASYTTANTSAPARRKLGAVWVMRPIHVLRKRRVG
jgi:hypothetical protein